MMNEVIDLAKPSKDRQIRENEILTAADKLFYQKGYQRTMVSDIVKKIGAAQGTLYYHFAMASCFITNVVVTIGAFLNTIGRFWNSYIYRVGTRLLLSKFLTFGDTRTILKRHHSCCHCGNQFGFF
jgi:hypothetical protein